MIDNFCWLVGLYKELVFECDSVFNLKLKYKIETNGSTNLITFKVSTYLGDFIYSINVMVEEDCVKIVNKSDYDRFWTKRTLLIISDLLSFMSDKKVELLNGGKIIYVSMVEDFIRFNGVNFSEDVSVKSLSKGGLLFLVKKLDLNNVSYFNIFDNSFSRNNVCVANNDSHEIVAIEDCPEFVLNKIKNYLKEVSKYDYKIIVLDDKSKTSPKYAESTEVLRRLSNSFKILTQG